MSLKRILASTALALSLSFTPANVHAGGIPVIDTTNLAEALRDAITQLEQLKAQYESLTGIVNQYEQMIRNAKGLGNLGDLADLLKDLQAFNEAHVSTDILGDLYTIDPAVTDFVDQAATVLGTDYLIPQTPIEVDGLLSDLKNTGSDVDGMLAKATQSRRDTDAVLQDMQAVTQSAQQSENSAKALEEYQRTLDSLGDDQTAASVQLLASIMLHEAQQNEALLEQLRIANLHAAKRELERLEDERLALEAAAQADRIYLENTKPYQRIDFDPKGL